MNKSLSNGTDITNDVVGALIGLSQVSVKARMSMFLSTTYSLICNVFLLMALAFRRQKLIEFADEEFNLAFDQHQVI